LLPQLLLTASLPTAFAAAAVVVAAAAAATLAQLAFWTHCSKSNLGACLCIKKCASANCISCAVRKFIEPLVGLHLHIHACEIN